MNRREMLRSSVGIAGASFLSGTSMMAETHMKKGRLKQSIAFWCFNAAGEKWSLERICQVAKELGCESVELVNTAEELATVKKHGLTCALLGLDMSPNPPFTHGYNNPDHWPKLFERTKKAIDAASEYGCPNVIAFTGYAYKNPDDPNSGLIGMEEGAGNCVKGLKKMAEYAAKMNVTLCLEPLNTRDDTHPMKGHPGYQGEHIEYCVDILRRVNFPSVKLLLDFYHTQIMDGDLIRRLREYKDVIGHIHTAGNPGRGELDDTQEIAYRPVMQALADIGYQGYVGHEYIPTRDPYKSLQEAVALCTV
ncbi:hydroxypyruvate isomerase family protein [Pelagicoccus mobilis]|uniref:TIM barrel protein n=1 Tax=Pelagicoccus mobilis TaxID=415221 RepID=A0A934RWL8_9BACT|nr:TIM barrel protein [Pelagicoccus mobilis]MBK1878147.1 TIM barrel protein [Pelagicoccus mobilis]